MKWQPIDKVPLEEPVLLRWDCGHIEDGRMYDIDGKLHHCLFDGEFLNDKPTHWMPLPEPPEEQ